MRILLYSRVGRRCLHSRARRADTRNLMVYILKFLRWVFEKFAVAALIVVLGLAACGVWIFLKDNVDFDQWRQDVLRSINGERAKVQVALADFHKRMDRISVEIRSEQDRGQEADKVLSQLKDLQST